MGMAGGEERQQRQSGHGGVGMAAGALAVPAQHVGFLAGAVGAGVPAAVGGLIVGEPFERGFHGGLGFGRAAVTLGHAGPVRGHAEAIGVGQRLRCVAASGRPAPALPGCQRAGRRGESARRGAAAGWRAGRPADPPALPAMRSDGVTIRGDCRPPAPGCGADCQSAPPASSPSLIRGRASGGWSKASGTSSDDGRTGRARGSSAKRSGDSGAPGGTAGAASRRWAGGASIAAADTPDAARPRRARRRLRPQRLGVGEGHVAERRIAGQPRVFGADQALRLRRLIGLSPLQFRALGLNGRVAGKDLPGLIARLGNRRRAGRRRRRTSRQGRRQAPPARPSPAAARRA